MIIFAAGLGSFYLQNEIESCTLLEKKFWGLYGNDVKSILILLKHPSEA